MWVAKTVHLIMRAYNPQTFVPGIGLPQGESNRDAGEENGPPRVIHRVSGTEVYQD